MATSGNPLPDTPAFAVPPLNVVDLPFTKPEARNAVKVTPGFEAAPAEVLNPFVHAAIKRRFSSALSVSTEHRAIPWMFGDAAVVAAVALIIFGLRFWNPLGAHLWPWGDVERFDPSSTQKYFGFLLLYSVLVVLLCNVQELYGRLGSSSLDDFIAISKAVVQASLVLTSFGYLAHVSIISRLIVCLTPAFTIIALTSIRHVHRQITLNRLTEGIGARNVLVVGTDHNAQMLANYLDANPQFGYAVKGLVGTSSANCDRVLGEAAEVQRIARTHFIDDIFIATPSDREVVKMITLAARQMNISVRVLPELYDGIGWDTPVQYAGAVPLRVLHCRPIPVSGLALKRCLDLAVSAFGLFVLSPLLGMIALLVKLDSAGPVIYRSSRVGKRGRIFTCYKFRTMVQNAEAVRAALQKMNERNGILFKIAHDPRITRVGRVLRRFSLDELPQLWNVLIGNMSLVGPRPPLPGEFRQYSLDHLRRLDVTPGVTGLWQVTARQNPSFQQYISLDLQYVENWSPLLDLKLLLRTLPVVLRGTGQ